MSGRDERTSRPRALALELAGLGVASVAFGALAIRADLFRRLDTVFRRHELIHLDEFVLTFAFLTTGFALLSLRRWFDLSRRNESLHSTEQALAAERDFTATVLDKVSSLVLVLDRDGRILRFNRACEAATGFAEHHVVGRPFWEILLPPETVAAQRASFQRLVTGKGPSSDENVWRARDGSDRLVLWTNTVVLDGGGEAACVVSTGRDVTDARCAERELRATEQRLEGILDSIDDFVWSQRAGTREMIFVSPAFERIYGIPAAELATDPRAWLRVIHADDRERVLEFIPDLLERGRAAMEYRIVRPDGTVRWIHDRAWGVRGDDGDWVRYDGIARDITDQKLLEEQLRQSQKMEAVGLLAGGIAHDFNNLLTAIGGHSEILVERLDDGPGRKSVVAIQRAAGRAAALTRQLLAFSRKQVLQPKVFNPNTLLLAIEPLVRRVAGADVLCTIDPAPALGDVRADPGQLEQVVMSLVANARDAMPHGGRLLVRTANVEIDGPAASGDVAPASGSYVALVVSDSGEGMNESVRARIFEPFFTTKATGQGIGLGLSTAYGIVRQSGGHIEVDSTPGLGATFRVLLPRHAGASIPEGPRSSKSAKAAPGALVLLVEDEPSVLELAREVLEDEGYHVVAARDGTEALEAIARHGTEIRLLVTDVVMPRMGGVELVERATPLLAEVPVLFMSGYSETVVRREGRVAPGAGFLQKPFSPADLAAAVRAALDRVAGTR